MWHEANTCHHATWWPKVGGGSSMILRARQTSNSHTTSYTYTIFTSTQQPTKRCLEQRQLNIGQMQLSYKQAPTSNIQHPYLKQVHTMLYAIGNQILNAPPPPPHPRNGISWIPTITLLHPNKIILEHNLLLLTQYFNCCNTAQ